MKKYLFFRVIVLRKELNCKTDMVSSVYFKGGGGGKGGLLPPPPLDLFCSPLDFG